MVGFPAKRAQRGIDFSQALLAAGWYHSFSLPDGREIQGFLKPEELRTRYSRFHLPEDLRDKRVLDIGAWDGWFSFEAERHGAAVTAIDCISIDNFHVVHRAVSSKVDYRVLDFYETPDADLGQFDFVFFLGVLYHLKHPLLALEIVCARTTDTAFVESFVIDAETYDPASTAIPQMEFYETDELGNQLDNWIGPSVACLLAMCRAAGFARVELSYAIELQAGVICHRNWLPEPEGPGSLEPPALLGARNARTGSVNFASKKEEYVSIWFRSSRAGITRTELLLEIGPFGVPALFAKSDDGQHWMANYRLPPGLSAGWHDVRLRFPESKFGNSLRVAVDLPITVDTLELTGVRGSGLNDGEGSVVENGHVSCWVRGLPTNVDQFNVFVRIGGNRMPIEFCGEPDEYGGRQLNVPISGVSPGVYSLQVECGGVCSNPREVAVLAG